MGAVSQYSELFSLLGQLSVCCPPPFFFFKFTEWLDQFHASSRATTASKLLLSSKTKLSAIIHLIWWIVRILQGKQYLDLAEIKNVTLVPLDSS